MKKNYIMLAAAWAVLFLFAACEKSGEVSQPAAQPVGVCVVLPEGLTPKIGYAEAAGIAQRGIAMLESSASTRTSGRRVLDPTNVNYVVTPATRSGESPDTLMYVFNFADSAGFAFVATARESDQLFAVTEKGTYTPGVPTGNPGFDFYMRCAENHLRSLSVGGGGIGGFNPPGLSEYIYKLDYEDDIDGAGPYLRVKWGQHWPYNMYCSECPSGCAATWVLSENPDLTQRQVPDTIKRAAKKCGISGTNAKSIVIMQPFTVENKLSLVISLL